MRTTAHTELGALHTAKQKDVFMHEVWNHLVGDFRATLGPEFSKGAVQAASQGIKNLRQYNWPGRMATRPDFFKRAYQLESLFKRYKFSNDLYTDDELESKAIEKFMATQERIGAPLLLTEPVREVIRRARRIIRELLGHYDLEEHFASCKFGKRASVGHPYAVSYLDKKIQMLTGSKDHILWFRKYLETDPLLQEILSSDLNRIKVCDTLALSTVPKSYKSLRTILANTDIGGFYTAGLGKVLERRLRKAGLNIKNLQERHRRLAQSHSKSRFLCTADLSAASDSVTRVLLRMLLPTKWYHVIMNGALQTVLVSKGRPVQMQSVITMGMGHTFPLQTLVFYSLIKAVGELAMPGRKCFVSVYGDDLMYPSQIHNHVERVFNHLHLIMNGDKTYVLSHFRESCGGDYYHGCDVRPFQPEGCSSHTTRVEFVSFVYKCLNGLLRRWQKEEIPSTVSYLLGLLVQLEPDGVKCVPPLFPDTSGYKVEELPTDLVIAPIYWCREKQSVVFRYIKKTNKLRYVPWQFPYYWESLRSMRDDTQSIWDVAEDSVTLIWKAVRPKGKRRVPSHTFGDFEGKTKKKPYVHNKTAYVVRESPGSASNWLN